MINCDFIYNEEEQLYICSRCQFKYKKNVRRNCIEKPNIVDKVINFSGALVKHVITGAKQSSQELIDKRLFICKECPLYIDNTCTHKSCGCNISNKQIFLNKLAWVEQKCPLNKW